jgi:hypothetical protein
MTDLPFDAERRTPTIHASTYSTNVHADRFTSHLIIWTILGGSAARSRTTARRQVEAMTFSSGSMGKRLSAGYMEIMQGDDTGT